MRALSPALSGLHANAFMEAPQVSLQAPQLLARSKCSLSAADSIVPGILRLPVSLSLNKIWARQNRHSASTDVQGSCGGD